MSQVEPTGSYAIKSAGMVILGRRFTER